MINTTEEKTQEKKVVEALRQTRRAFAALCSLGNYMATAPVGPNRERFIRDVNEELVDILSYYGEICKHYEQNLSPGITTAPIPVLAKTMVVRRELEGDAE